MLKATDAIRYGWGVAKKNWKFFVVIMLVQYAISYSPSLYALITGETAKNYDALYYLVYVVSSIINLMVSVGFVIIVLKLIDDKSPTFSDLFSTKITLILKYIALSILVMLVVTGGIFLLIIPGFYFGLRLSLAQYYLIDKNMGIMEAYKASWHATKGNLLYILRYGSLAFLVVLGGALALAVGLLIAIPTVAIGQAYVYRKIASKQ